MMAAGLWCLMTASAQTVDSIGWRSVFMEPQLVGLIETALERNADLRTATLQEELAFLDRYLALLQQRFGEGIQVRIADEVTQLQGKLPPAALQMLIENAIKHNEHTQTRPLIIDVTADGQRISVSNKKQPITNAESTSVGQHNIVERYRLLTSQKVVISSTQDEYRVSIPLIPIER